MLGNLTAIVNDGILQVPNDHLTDILLFGSPSFENSTNKAILQNTIWYIKLTKRFLQIEAYSHNINTTLND